MSDMEISTKKDTCQRFYSQGKKIPKNVKRHCGMCRQHNVVVETRGHHCKFKNCDCVKCKLVRQRRSIMSTQIRLRREQDKKFQRTTDVTEADIVPWSEEDKEKKDDANMCYFCQKCKNHGILKWKKDHKKMCEFTNCRCEQCDLIDTRRVLDRNIKSKKMIRDSLSCSGSNSSSSTPELSSASLSTSTSSSSSTQINTEQMNPPSTSLPITDVHIQFPFLLPTSFLPSFSTLSPSPTFSSSFSIFDFQRLMQQSSSSIIPTHIPIDFQTQILLSNMKSYETMMLYRNSLESVSY